MPFELSVRRVAPLPLVKMGDTTDYEAQGVYSLGARLGVQCRVLLMNQAAKTWDPALKVGKAQSMTHPPFDVLFGSFDLLFMAVLHPSRGTIAGSVYRRPSPKREEEGGTSLSNAKKVGVVLPGRYIHTEGGACRLALVETIEERILHVHRQRFVRSKVCPGPTAKEKLHSRVMQELHAVDGSVDGSADGSSADGSSAESAVDGAAKPIGTFTLTRQLVGIVVDDSVTGVRKQLLATNRQRLRAGDSTRRHSALADTFIPLIDLAHAEVLLQRDGVQRPARSGSLHVPSIMGGSRLDPDGRIGGRGTRKPTMAVQVRVRRMSELVRRAVQHNRGLLSVKEVQHSVTGGGHKGSRHITEQILSRNVDDEVDTRLQLFSNPPAPAPPAIGSGAPAKTGGEVSDQCMEEVDASMHESTADSMHGAWGGGSGDKDDRLRAKHAAKFKVSSKRSKARAAQSVFGQSKLPLSDSSHRTFRPLGVGVSRLQVQ
jgi:hypothetical protein